MTGIARGPRPTVSYFQTESDNKITYMVRNLLLNSINRSLAIFLYKNKGIFNRPNSCNVFNSILASNFTSTNCQLVKICHVARNLASCVIATPRGSYPIMFLLLTYQFRIIYIFVVFKNIVSVGSSK